MPGGVVERLRALHKSNRGGAFFGSEQTQLFTPKFNPSTYATAEIVPSSTYFALLAYMVRFPHELEPNAFSFNLLSRGDLLLSAVLTSDYIASGFELLTPITQQLPLAMRIANGDAIPQFWAASFDLLTIQNQEELDIVIALLNDERPDIAAMLRRQNPSTYSASPLEQIGAAGGPFRQDNFGTPLRVFEEPVKGSGNLPRSAPIPGEEASRGTRSQLGQPAGTL